MSELFMQITTILTGLYFIPAAFLMHTTNKKSALIYQVIPFFLGLGCLITGLKLIGLV